MNIDKYGYWTTPEKKFYKKTEALVYATQYGMPVKFNYHDSVFEEFDRSQLGKIPLNVLYKERALQLREKYDYLILYYSAGSDSHNILTSFVNNGIKLDEVCVRWPTALRNHKLYTPNTQDKSARNFCSEWDYSIKPKLEWIASNHPTIKITIKDYVENRSGNDMERLFDQIAGCASGGGMLFSSAFSDSEKELLLQNKKVGNIFGVDKPILTYDQNTRRVFMLFSDNALKEAGVNPFNPEGTEPFYWSPDMPSLAFEQAYRLCQHYDTNYDDRTYLWEFGKEPTGLESKIKNQFQQDLGRQLLYSNWTNSFQTEKSTNIVLADKFFWLYESPELSSLKEYFIGNLQDRLKQINQEWLQPLAKLENRVVGRYKTFTATSHYITTLSKISW